MSSFSGPTLLCGDDGDSALAANPSSGSGGRPLPPLLCFFLCLLVIPVLWTGSLKSVTVPLTGLGWPSSRINAGNWGAASRDDSQRHCSGPYPLKLCARAVVHPCSRSAICSRVRPSNRRDLLSPPAPLTAENWGTPGMRPGADLCWCPLGRTTVFRSSQLWVRGIYCFNSAYICCALCDFPGCPQI